MPRRQGRIAAERKTGRSISVSQNFLTGRRTVERIVGLAGLHPDDHVIEIGPGKGHITRALLACGARVTAVEIDGGLCAALHEKFAAADGLRLVNRDFLRWPLPARGDYRVFSNIPFNRTTEIVRKLTGAVNPPEESFLVMEKGAAKRFLGRPRESLSSLLIKPRFDARIVYYFRREDFHPMPGADAVLVRFRKKAVPDIPKNNRDGWERFVTGGLRAGPAALRRTVGSARWALAMCMAGELETAGPAAGCGTDAGGSETLRYVQWLCLFRCAGGKG